MKKLFFVLGIVFFSQLSLAGNIFTCQNRLEKPMGPIVGAELKLNPNPAKGAVDGTISLLCSSCKFQPKIITFDKGYYRGAIYVYQGKTYILEISFKTLLAAKTYAAVLTDYTAKKKFSYSCKMG